MYMYDVCIYVCMYVYDVDVGTFRSSSHTNDIHQNLNPPSPMFSEDFGPASLPESPYPTPIRSNNNNGIGTGGEFNRSNRGVVGVTNSTVSRDTHYEHQQHYHPTAIGHGSIPTTSSSTGGVPVSSDVLAENERLRSVIREVGQYQHRCYYYHIFFVSIFGCSHIVCLL